MQKPLISICLADSSKEKLSRETLESVLAQTYENFELIVIDNSPEYSSSKIVYQYTDSRIRLYKDNEYKGFYQAINLATSLAKGELITILNFNDLYAQNFLDEIVSAYSSYPTKKVFVTGLYYYYSDENYLKAWHPFKIQGLKNRQEILLNLIEGNNIGNNLNMAYSRSCLLQTGFFSEDYKHASSYEYWVKLAEKYDFVYIPKLLAYYRIFSSDGMLDKNAAMLEESSKIFKNRLLKSSLLETKTCQEALFIRTGNEIRKAFQAGLEHRSGKYTRKMLEVLRKNFPEESRNFYLYFVQVASYFMGVSFLKGIISIIGEGVLYPYKKTSEFKQRMLFYKKPPVQKSSCSSGCGSCGGGCH